MLLFARVATEAVKTVKQYAQAVASNVLNVQISFVMNVKSVLIALVMMITAKIAVPVVLAQESAIAVKAVQTAQLFAKAVKRYAPIANQHHFAVAAVFIARTVWKKAEIGAQAVTPAAIVQ